MRAIILAAGTGSRLRPVAPSCPKPLYPVGSKPLLFRVVETLRRAGIRELVVVVGYQGKEVRRRLLEALAVENKIRDLGIEVEFVENENYLARNGLSLLAARDYVTSPCVLSMADHLYSPSIVQKLLTAELPRGACALGVDRAIDRCFDLEDATKVGLDGERIVRIGKDLPVYDALDTGVFRIDATLIEALDRAAERTGDCSLSEGVQLLGEQGRFFGCDVGEARWIDVDTPEAAVYAELMLRAYGDELASGSSRRSEPVPVLAELEATSSAA